ncbi:MAG: ornithine cyclodeaminase family protein [Pseudomonadota bacterium]
MDMIDARRVDELLAYPSLIDVLGVAFREGAASPLRHHHQIPRGELAEATLLLMPAWTLADGSETIAGDFAGVKLVTVTPDNGPRHALPAISALYVLIETDTGKPLSLIDGAKLTVWRTAAASGLASRYLSRADSRHLLLVGAGALAPYLARAHASVRPIDTITIWNRTPANAKVLADTLASEGFATSVADDLTNAVANADIVSTATISETALISGDALSAGTHLDCVGAFRPNMRETDDTCVQRARIYVDTMVGGTEEAGDIVLPLSAGVISKDDIVGDLFALARGEIDGRRGDTEITMFKSVGASIEDLFAAVAVHDANGAMSPAHAEAGLSDDV